MLPLAALLAATALLPALSGGPRAVASPSCVNDTVPPAVDTIHTVDTLPSADTAAPARVAFDLGHGTGPATRVRSIELGVTAAPNPYLRNQVVATTRLRLTRSPDSLSAEFSRRVSTSEHIPVVEVQLRPGAGAPPMVVRLYDAVVVSTKLTSNGDDAALRQQQLALMEAMAGTTADLQEGERQLAVTSSLEKRHLASPIELARARGTAALLAARLAAQRQRLALIEREIAEWVPLEEEVVLSAARRDSADAPASP